MGKTSHFYIFSGLKDITWSEYENISKIRSVLIGYYFSLWNWLENSNYVHFEQYDQNGFLFFPIFKNILGKPSLALYLSMLKTSMTTVPRWSNLCRLSVTTCLLWTWPLRTWTGLRTAGLSVSLSLINQPGWQKDGK